MKVLTLINEYRSPTSGEEEVVRSADAALQRRGVATRVLRRSSDELLSSVGSRVRAAWAGAYDRRARREFAALLDSDPPDLVHAHNLYPLFSPSVLEACRERGVPTVYTSHNFGLTCPALNHLRAGGVCEKCLDGSVWSCVRHNCCNGLAKSAAYAYRSAVARRRRLFVDNVTLFVVLSRFAAEWFARGGFDAERIVVLPNMMELPPVACEPDRGETVLFCGRLVEAKGLWTLVEAARALPDVPFEVAGTGPIEGELRAAAPPNVRCLGWLDSKALDEAYSRARSVLVPSLSFENCPLVILEAQARGLPVIASRFGALPELVEDGVHGFLVEPGDRSDGGAELARAIRRLVDEPMLAREMGRAGRERIRLRHSESAYVDALLAIYERALAAAQSPLPGSAA
jgi:glycosyltransferase involved in cell wall biosynthesis